jgi:hypothetical protein
MTNSSKGNGFGVDFDTYWKEILDLIEPATRFFLPELHQQVDWSIDYISLEQELRNLYERKKGRVKRTDKLFRFKLLNGEDHYLLFHLEVEAYPTALFPERMFEYFVRHRFKYSNTPITMLAIFVGKKPVESLDAYSFDCFGTECTFKYNTFSVATQQEMELLQSDNPFALVILANLYVIQSKGDMELRLRLKRKLLKHIANSNFSSEIVRNIFNFAVYFITLPQEEEKTIVHFMNKQAQAQPQAKKQTYAQKAEADRKKLLDAYYLAMFGKTEEDILADIEEGEGIQEERAMIEEEKAMIEEEKATIQAERRKMIVYLYSNVNLSAQEIATVLGFDLTYVESVLANLPPENN